MGQAISTRNPELTSNTAMPAPARMVASAAGLSPLWSPSGSLFGELGFELGNAPVGEPVVGARGLQPFPQRSVVLGKLADTLFKRGVLGGDPKRGVLGGDPLDGIFGEFAFGIAEPPEKLVDDSVQGTGTGQFNYVGTGWGHVGVGGEGAPAYPYDGSNSYDATAGDYATITFYGTQIAYYAVTDTSCGIAAVSVDGGPETLVDLYSPSRAGDVLVWTSPVLPAGTHTIKIRVTGTKNPASSYDWITIDRAEITTS